MLPLLLSPLRAPPSNLLPPLPLAFPPLHGLKGAIKVVHIKYRDTTAASLATCAAICDATGLPFSDDYQGKVESYLAASKAKRAAQKAKGLAAGGKAGALHSYSLEEYGLSEAHVATMFKDYIEKFC